MAQPDGRRTLRTTDSMNNNNGQMHDNMRKSVSSRRLDDSVSQPRVSSSASVVRTQSLKSQRTDDYTLKAFREIRQSLKKHQDRGPVVFKNNAGSSPESSYSGSSPAAGNMKYNGGSTPVALANDPVRNARLQLTMQQNMNGRGVLRRPSFDDRLARGTSPCGSEVSSVQSDSPDVARRALPPGPPDGSQIRHPHFTRLTVPGVQYSAHSMPLQQLQHNAASAELTRRSAQLPQFVDTDLPQYRPSPIHMQRPELGRMMNTSPLPSYLSTASQSQAGGLMAGPAASSNLSVLTSRPFIQQQLNHDLSAAVRTNNVSAATQFHGARVLPAEFDGSTATAASARPEYAARQTQYKFFAPMAMQLTASQRHALMQMQPASMCCVRQSVVVQQVFSRPLPRPIALAATVPTACTVPPIRQQQQQQLQRDRAGSWSNEAASAGNSEAMLVNELCRLQPSSAAQLHALWTAQQPMVRRNNGKFHSPSTSTNSNSDTNDWECIDQRLPPPYPHLKLDISTNEDNTTTSSEQAESVTDSGLGDGIGQADGFEILSSELQDTLVLHESENDAGSVEQADDWSLRTMVNNEAGNNDNDSDTVADGSEKCICHSPKPQRRPSAEEMDKRRPYLAMRHYPAAAFRFYMAQHYDNLIRQVKEREERRSKLERDMLELGIADDMKPQLRLLLQQKESNYNRLKRVKLNKDMFIRIQTLGVGAFGEVVLVQKRDTLQLFAMKILRWSEVVRRNQIAHVKAERDILAEADNDWVVKLYWSFRDDDCLYFILEYIPGGDLMGLLIKQEIFSEELARFYIAELVVAIENVHTLGFIHRDIKPDNILIDKQGHIKLTDFGLCTGFRPSHSSQAYKQIVYGHAKQDSMLFDCADQSDGKETAAGRPLSMHQKAHSLVGTPNYIAPEVLEQTSYTASCDWWSVGVILYEMLVGQPPFYAPNASETQWKVVSWKSCLYIPPQACLSVNAEDLIRRLCCDADNRLGRNGADEIKAHPFFRGVDFATLRKQQSPFVPQIKHPTDTSYFDPVDAGRLAQHDDAMPSSEFPNHALLDFTFRRFFDEIGHPGVKYNDALLEEPETESCDVQQVDHTITSIATSAAIDDDEDVGVYV